MTLQKSHHPSCRKVRTLLLLFPVPDQTIESEHSKLVKDYEVSSKIQIVMIDADVHIFTAFLPILDEPRRQTSTSGVDNSSTLLPLD